MVKVTCPNGKEFRYKKNMCEYYNTKYPVYLRRLREDWTERQALGIDPPPPAFICPNGLEFRYKKDMCSHYKTKFDTYNSRLLNGWTERQALGIDPPPEGVGGSRVITCPRGLRFSDKKAMCNHYGVRYHTFLHRESEGWTLEDALGLTERDLYKVTCPKGRTFRDKKEMCQHYGVPYQTYFRNKRLGYTEKQALGIDSKSTKVVCPQGINHGSIKNLCDYYGIPEHRYYTLSKNGLRLSEILTAEVGKTRSDLKVVCPNGITFENRHRMCEHYELPYHMYAHRIKADWTERQALNLDPPPTFKHAVICPNGIEFKTRGAMCKHYGVSIKTRNNRLNKQGWTERQALGIDPPPTNSLTKPTLPDNAHSWNSNLTVLESKRQLNENLFYLVQDNQTSTTYVLTEQQIKTYPQSLQTFKKPH